MEWWQIVLTARGRKVLFPEEDAMRDAVRALVRATGAALLLFCIVDDHIHVVIEGDRAQAGRLAQALGVALGRRTDVPLQPAWYGMVEDRAHLLTLVRYVLTQPSHHPIGVPDALWTGSCFQDLVGARWIPGFEPNLWRVLPRLRMRDLFPMVGMPVAPLLPLSAEGVAAVGMSRVRSAAAQAACVGTALAGREREVVKARSTAAKLGMEAGFGRTHVAGILRCTVRGVGGLLDQERVPALEQAVRIRLALEDAARKQVP